MWLTFSTAVYYRESSCPLGGGLCPEHILDFGLRNVNNVLDTFRECQVVIYYNSGVPVSFLQRVRALSRVILVYVDMDDLRAPMLGRLAELDVRRTEWTVTLDIHDDIRHPRMRPIVEVIASLPRNDQVVQPVRLSTWRAGGYISEYISRMTREFGCFDICPDAAGVMIHQSAPKVDIEPLCDLQRPYCYGDDEVILMRWLGKLYGDWTASAEIKLHKYRFVELDLDLSNVRILDKRPSSACSEYASEVWKVD